jgi:phosphatidate phosphatase APP1
VHGSVLGTETTARTDADGYFRLHWRLDAPAPQGPPWRAVELRLEDHPGVGATAAEVYIPPPQAKFVVISDIDDTVMHTGVANKLIMTWRLFAQSAHSRTAFPGVAQLYRALHRGASGDEGNPMLYVSRAPWGIYDVLDEFFRSQAIPVGPILFLREWGLSWCTPLPRRAEDHKRVLIDAIMEIYHDLPFILIGDSGQRDPEIYADVVRRNGSRVRAVYIREVARSGRNGRRDRDALVAAAAVAGSEVVIAADTAVIAEHAASLGLVAPEAVAAVRAERDASVEE